MKSKLHLLLMTTDEVKNILPEKDISNVPPNHLCVVIKRESDTFPTSADILGTVHPDKADELIEEYKKTFQSVIKQTKDN